MHFDFEGYDTSPFWDDDGKVYITGAHAWRVAPGIWMAEADLEIAKRDSLVARTGYRTYGHYE